MPVVRIKGVSWFAVLLALAPATPCFSVEPAVDCEGESCWRPRLTQSLSIQSPPTQALTVSVPIRSLLQVTPVREPVNRSLAETPGAVWMTGQGLARQFDLAERQAVALTEVRRARFALSAQTFRETNALGDGAEARLLSPRLSLRSVDARQFLNLDYTDGQYAMPAPGVPAYRLRQFAPAVGMEIAERQDWLTLRFYDVRSPDAARSLAAPTRARAVETKWVRNLDPAAGGPNQLQFSTLFGNRLHAVDPDSASIFSLTDMQTGGVSMGASWTLTPHAKWMVNGGYDRFEQGGLGGQEYINAYLFTGVKGRW